MDPLPFMRYLPYARLLFNCLGGHLAATEPGSSRLAGGVFERCLALIGAIWLPLELTQGLGLELAFTIVLVAFCLTTLSVFIRLLFNARWEPFTKWGAIVLMVGFGVGAPGILIFRQLQPGHPVFGFSRLSFASPEVLIALPSHQRATLYYRKEKCVGDVEPPLASFCSGARTTESFLTYNVILFSELEAAIDKIRSSHSRARVYFAASWRDDLPPQTPLDGRHLVVIGGPISTAYFKRVRDEIIRNISRVNLPYDFSSYIYDQLYTTEPYGDDKRNAIIRYFEPYEASHPWIDEKMATEKSRSPGRGAIYEWSAVRDTRRSPLTPGIVGGGESCYVITAVHSHDNDRCKDGRTG